VIQPGAPPLIFPFFGADLVDVREVPDRFGSSTVLNEIVLHIARLSGPRLRPVFDHFRALLPDGGPIPDEARTILLSLFLLDPVAH